MADLGFDIAEEQDDYIESPFPEDLPDSKIAAPLENSTLNGSANHGQEKKKAMREHDDQTALGEDADEFPEATPPEGFNTDSLLQAMSEEVSTDDLEDDLLMDESLTPMERIYMFNKSDMMIHRLLVAKELANTINEISVSEAVNYVLPMVLKIGTDPDDAVRETFVSELDRIIMYYYKNAPPVLEPSSTGAQTKNKNVQNIAQTSTTPPENEELEPISVPAPVVEETMDVNNTTDTKKDKMKHDVQHRQDDKGKHPEERQRSIDEDRPSSESPSSSRSQSPSSKASDDEDLHIPVHVFVPLLIEFLLGQNSSLASLGQQCIVSVATELANPKDTENEEYYKKLLDVEILDGVVSGLMTIVDGKARHPESDAHDMDNEGSSEERSNNFDEGGFIGHHPSADDIDQGEINLAKMMCLSLISALANVLGSERCTNLCLPIVERMANDQMFYVRKEAAAAIGNLAVVVDQQVVLDRLLPLYQTFSRDTIWHVRRSCVVALPLLCGVLPEDVRAQTAVEGVKLFKNDVSRNVRNSLADIIGELIAKFLPEDWETTGRPGKVPEPLLEFFLSLGPSPSSNQVYKLETDRAIVCAYNFPAVVLTAGADYWDSHLKETYLNLTKDYQIKVRRSFAYSLHEIARIIGPERTERDLVQIFALYLMDLDDVKQGVLEHLAEFLGTLAVSSRNEYIPILAEVWDGVMTNWRLRDILAAQLRDIALLFDAARVVEHILPLAIRACKDEFAAVRETGVEAFPVILDIVKRAVDEDGETLSQSEQEGEDSIDSRREFALALLNHVMEKLDEFVRAESYRGRLIFVQICKLLLEAGICAADFASFFLPRLAPLSEDPIVNVRIATSRVIRTIHTNDAYKQELQDLLLPDALGEGESRPAQTLDEILYRLALDKDIDVRSFVQDLVDLERLKARRDEMLDDYPEEHQEQDEQAVERHERPEILIHDAENAGSPMVESPTNPGTRNDDISEQKDHETTKHRNDVEEDNDKEELRSAGTPMDCTAEEDEDDSSSSSNSSDHDSTRESKQNGVSNDEDEMMTDASGPEKKLLQDDKEKEEYVYLSKSMVHQDETRPSPHSPKHSPPQGTV